MCLTGTVIRILSEDNNLDVFKSRLIQCTKNLFAWRVNHAAVLLLLQQKGPQFFHVVLFKLRSQ